MPTTTISTIQAKQALDATHFLFLSAVPIVIYDIEGNTSSTTGTSYYIQLLGTAAPVSGTTIPLYSRLCVQSGTATGINGFSFVYRPVGIDTQEMTNPTGGTVGTQGLNTLPIYVAISSTDTVYTAVAASTNVTVNFEESILPLANEVITGDLTTGVDSLAVWADDANGAKKRLIQFDVSNSVASTSVPLYLQLFAYTTPATGATALQEWTINGTTQVTETFGDGIPFQQYSAVLNSSGIFVIGTTLHVGCYLYGSSTPQFFTATAATQWKMRAYNV